MHALWEALPSDRRGRYAESSAELQAHVLAAVNSGDIVMVKGSLGSRMTVIVKALEHHATRVDTARVRP
jgi:UDP-N-acetylmuramoyl-tripeptide--D-alanyl-D-alanine ligase